MTITSSRRTFVRRLAAALAVLRGTAAVAQPSGRIGGIDHMAIPMRDTDAMLAFYRGLGLEMRETPSVVSVYAGEQMINLHRPSLWQNASFTLRAPAATPPCGDVCFVWDGGLEALEATLKRVGAKIIEGPVARQGGRRRDSTSLYVRDPDGNLVEFMIYG